MTNIIEPVLGTDRWGVAPRGVDGGGGGGEGTLSLPHESGNEERLAPAVRLATSQDIHETFRGGKGKKACKQRGHCEGGGINTNETE